MGVWFASPNGMNYTQNDKRQKNHHINLNKPIWSFQCEWVINLDYVILIGSMTNKMTIYLTSR
jgi:hypothetical protein